MLLNNITQNVLTKLKSILIKLYKLLEQLEILKIYFGFYCSYFLEYVYLLSNIFDTDHMERSNKPVKSIFSQFAKQFWNSLKFNYKNIYLQNVALAYDTKNKQVKTNYAVSPFLMIQS